MRQIRGGGREDLEENYYGLIECAGLEHALRALWPTGGGSTLDPMVVRNSPIVFAATRVKQSSGFFARSAD